MRHLRPLCGHCIFWKSEDDPRSTVGHCHRYPPGVYVNPESGIVAQKFPTTDHKHWCGEWDGDKTRLDRMVRESAAVPA